MLVCCFTFAVEISPIIFRESATLEVMLALPSCFQFRCQVMLKKTVSRPGSATLKLMLGLPSYSEWFLRRMLYRVSDFTRESQRGDVISLHEGTIRFILPPE